MNEKDLMLMEELLKAMDASGLNGAILVDVPSTQFVRFNIMLLRGLSQDRSLPGLFVSVDRPHQYMVHLLSMHHIKAERLMYIDAISRFSADCKIAPANVGFVDGPFHIDKLPAAMSEYNSSDDSKKTGLKDCRYAIIDNLSALLTYNSFGSVELFLRDFVKVFESPRKALVILVIDKEKSAPLYELAKTLCASEIRFRQAIETRASGDSGVKTITDITYCKKG